MSEQGSHGGSSPSETTIPIVLLSSAFQHGKGLTSILFSHNKIRNLKSIHLDLSRMQSSYGLR